MLTKKLMIGSFFTTILFIYGCNIHKETITKMNKTERVSYTLFEPNLNVCYKHHGKGREDFKISHCQANFKNAQKICLEENAIMPTKDEYIKIFNERNYQNLDINSSIKNGFGCLKWDTPIEVWGTDAIIQIFRQTYSTNLRITNSPCTDDGYIKKYGFKIKHFKTIDKIHMMHSKNDDYYLDVACLKEK